jgi:translation initiation factor 1 (eIF-1/SUI1)
MGKKDKSTKAPATTSEKLVHNPFAKLAVASIAVQPVVASAAIAETPPEREARKRSRGRLILRRETKHRGGKAVIVVSGFEALSAFGAGELEALAKELKQLLGCGGTVESACELVLQGDQPAKVAELLRAKGFRVDGVTS